MTERPPVTAENNRFERWFQQAARRPRALLVPILVIVLLLELAAAWGYIAKRLIGEQPVIDLVERFHLVRPFGTLLFPDQYRFPAVLADRYAGDINTEAGQRAIYEGDGVTGHRLRPNTVTSEVIWTWRATDGRGFVISDRDNPESTISPDKPDDVFRIIVLGGSTVEGDGASGSLNALPASLWQALKQSYRPADNPQRRFEVINAGVGGFYSDQEFLYYYSELQYLEPDLLVIYHGWNDLVYQNRLIEKLGPNGGFSRQGKYAENRDILDRYFSVTATAGRLLELSAQRILEFLDGFALLHSMARGGNMLLNRLQTSMAGAAPSEPAPFFSPLSVDRMAANVRLILTINEQRDIPTAWFLQPLVGLGNKPPAAFREAGYVRVRQPYIERRKTFYALAESAQQRLGEAFPGRRLCAASLTDVFDGNPDAVYEDFGHLFDIGNDIVARRIARELQACGLIAPR